MDLSSTTVNYALGRPSVLCDAVWSNGASANEVPFPVNAICQTSKLQNADKVAQVPPADFIVHEITGDFADYLIHHIERVLLLIDQAMGNRKFVVGLSNNPVDCLEHVFPELKLTLEEKQNLQTVLSDRVQSWKNKNEDAKAVDEAISREWLRTRARVDWNLFLKYVHPVIYHKYVVETSPYYAARAKRFFQFQA